MLLSRSFQRKVVATCGAALGFALLHEARVFDSREALQDAEQREAVAPPVPGSHVRFSATAYCKGEVTAAGTAARTGIAAADPELLPVGSVVQVDSLGPRYNGIYTVMDTGPAVKGRELDLYMWSCKEAVKFGRQAVRLTVLRLGWNPRASTPEVIGAWLRNGPAARRQTPPAGPVNPIDGAAAAFVPTLSADEGSPSTPRR